MLVVDASVAVAVAFFIADDAAATAAARVLRADAHLWAPHLIDAEVGHALRKATNAGLIDAGVGAAALGDLPELPIQRVPHQELLADAWSLRDNVSFHDALYVALAARLGVPLATYDARLARAAKHLVDIEPVD